MDREELLRHLGLKGDELRDFLRKFADFQRELSPAQRKVLLGSLPSLERASQTLGTTAENLEELFREELNDLKDVIICGFEDVLHDTEQ